MRRRFKVILHDYMETNQNAVVLTADLGYGMFDDIKKDFPTRFYNVGSAEQLMLGLGVGLTLAGKKAILYSISPFLLYRPFEWLRNYLSNEQIPVKLIGGGRDKDYAHDGPTHWCEDDETILKTLKIDIFKPKDEKELDENIVDLLDNNIPTYINLRR